MHAHAAVAVQPHRVVYQPIEVPEPAADDVVLRVTHSWISNGTEGSFVRGERIGGDTPRSEGDPLPFPHVPGYQKVGIVEWVGAAVSGIVVGDTAFATVSKVEGMFYSTGGHVSPAVTHHSQIFTLPPEVSPVSAACLVLAQVGVNVGMRADMRPGDPALVIGDGMVGHWSAQTLRHRGARVLLAGRHDERLARFDPGDDGVAFNVAKQDLLEAARDFAPDGMQVLADTVGSVATIEAFLPVLRHNAHIVSAGFHGTNGRIDIQKLRDRELTLHAPSGWTSERLLQTMDLLRRGALSTESLLTHRFAARDAGAAFDLILSRREPVLGVLLEWE